MDLSQFVNKKVIVTRLSGEVREGLIKMSPPFLTNYPFTFQYEYEGAIQYHSFTKEGKFVKTSVSVNDIVKVEIMAEVGAEIEEEVVKSPNETLKTSKEIQNQIDSLKKELEIALQKEAQGDKLPRGFNRDTCLEILEDPSEFGYLLVGAFYWPDAPQGDHYWSDLNSDIADGRRRTFPSEAIIQIQKWVIASYRQQCGELLPND